jgi:hypothetical protein
MTTNLRSVRIEAQYGAVPWACPESVAVEWTEAAPTAFDINLAIAQLAAVPVLARIDGEPRVPDGAEVTMHTSGGLR